MGPIPKMLSVVLLVGCLVLAVAAAREREGGKGAEILCEGSYKDRRVWAEELATILRNHQAWLEAVQRKLDEKTLESRRMLRVLRSQWALWLEAESELTTRGEPTSAGPS
jgi:hypothetical protein